MTGCVSGEFRYCRCFVFIKASIFKNLPDELVVKGFGNDVKGIFHCFSNYSPGNSLAWAKAGSPLRTLMRFWVAMVACLTTDS